jgi:hypothetical protein
VRLISSARLDQADKDGKSRGLVPEFRGISLESAKCVPREEEKRRKMSELRELEEEPWVRWTVASPWSPRARGLDRTIGYDSTP